MTTDNKQYVLTGDEVENLLIQYNSGRTPPSANFLGAFEQAVLSKLLGVGEPSDEEIMGLAREHIAPHYGKIGLNDTPYQQTEQFRRVKAFARDAALEEAAKIADLFPNDYGDAEMIADEIRALKSAPAAEDSAKGAGDDWRIDRTAGRPILVYKNCSVIEAEDAEYVLSLIRADRQQRGGEVDERVEFEAWIKRLPFQSNIKRLAGHYQDQRIALSWMSWQARAALSAQSIIEKPEIEKQLKESLAYLETLANFGGTIQQARELAQKGVNKLTKIKGEG